MKPKCCNCDHKNDCRLRAKRKNRACNNYEHTIEKIKEDKEE